MRTISGGIFAVGLWLAAAGGVAKAADLYTPPFWSGASPFGALCKITNVSTKDKLVQYQLIDASGAALFDSGEVTLAPGLTHATIKLAPASNVHCHFHVKGPKGSVRAAGTASTTSSPFSNGDFLVVPAN